MTRPVESDLFGSPLNLMVPPGRSSISARDGNQPASSSGSVTNSPTRATGWS